MIEDEQKVKNNYNHINLVPSFKVRNFCRLCYVNPGSQENLQKHEEEEHSDEKDLLGKSSKKKKTEKSDIVQKGRVGWTPKTYF